MNFCGGCLSTKIGNSENDCLSMSHDSLSSYSICRRPRNRPGSRSQTPNRPEIGVKSGISHFQAKKENKRPPVPTMKQGAPARRAGVTGRMASQHRHLTVELTPTALLFRPGDIIPPMFALFHPGDFVPPMGELQSDVLLYGRRVLFSRCKPHGRRMPPACVVRLLRTTPI